MMVQKVRLWLRSSRFAALAVMAWAGTAICEERGKAESLPVIQLSTVSFETALEVARAGLDAATQKKKVCKTVAVSVVDAAGRELVMLKNDAGTERLTSESYRKAWTAVNVGVSTKELLALVKKNEGDDAQLPNIHNALIMMGGIPLKDGDAVVGAVGVAGCIAGSYDQEAAVIMVEVFNKLLSK